MIQKRGLSEFGMSEPEFLISVMDRKKDWCTIVCLIGGGQEINTGEAGLVEWFDALQRSFGHWDVYYSNQITHRDYSWGQNLASKLISLGSQPKEALHLAVSVRSFRAEKLSAFVSAIIDGDLDQRAGAQFKRTIQLASQGISNGRVNGSKIRQGVLSVTDCSLLWRDQTETGRN